MANRQNLKIICAPFDFGQKAKAAEQARRIEAECLESIASAEAAKDQPKSNRASASSGPRSGSKRASIKRAWLADLEAWNSKPAIMLGNLLAIGIESSESSIASIRSDLRACMLAIGADEFAPAFQPMLNGKGLRANDPLADLNRALWMNPSLDRKSAIELLAGRAREDFIGGSLAASKESISILMEMGAFEKSENQAIAA